jgi:hypothetical protein
MEQSGVIKDKFPWLWQMKELISERPNIVPVGLGNNDSTIDMSAYTTGYNSDHDIDYESSKPDGTEGEEDATYTDNEDADEDEDIESDHDVAVMIPTKRPAKPVEKKTGARPGKSNPARHESKKSKVIDRFADVANAEEVTNQKHLELKKIRVQGETQASVAKIKAQAEIQIQKDKLKAQARMQEKRQEHEFRMAQLNFQSSSAGYGRHHSQASSRAPSSFGYENSPTPSQSHLFDSNTVTAGSFDFNNFTFESPVSEGIYPSLPAAPAPAAGEHGLEDHGKLA